MKANLLVYEAGSLRLCWLPAALALLLAVELADFFVGRDDDDVLFI